MRFTVKHSMSKAVSVLGLLGAAFTQVGCAHPVVVEPSVAFSTHIGHASVYGQVGVPGPVIYAPAPARLYAPHVPFPRVIYGPPVYRVAPGWQGHGHGPRWGYGRHDGGRSDHGRRDDHRGHR
jgi:hypothetical protein